MLRLSLAVTTILNESVNIDQAEITVLAGGAIPPPAPTRNQTSARPAAGIHLISHKLGDFGNRGVIGVNKMQFPPSSWHICHC